MIAASSDFMDTSRDRSSSSHSTCTTTQNPNHIQDLNDAVDDEFGSFTAAEELLDPFGDVYGTEADFGEFVGGSKSQSQTSSFSVAMDASSLGSFSTLLAPTTMTAPPTLLSTTCGEMDPFADIIGGQGCPLGTREEEKEEMKNVPGPFEGELVDERNAAASSLTSSAKSAILDLVWGNSSQERDGNLLSMSATSIKSGRSRTTSTSSGSALPLPTSTKFATFQSATVETFMDLMLLSPVRASTPIDPFEGIDCDTDRTSAAAAPVFDTDEVFSAASVIPTSSSSAPTSLHESFVSLYDDITTPRFSHVTPDAMIAKAFSSQDPFTKHTSRSLSSSVVNAGTTEDEAGRNGMHAPFSTFSRATLPSSAPPSLQSSFKISDKFLGFVPVADESDKVDPFAEAGLAAPAEAPLAEALAAWSIDAEQVMDKNIHKDGIEMCAVVKDAGDKYELAADASHANVRTNGEIYTSNAIRLTIATERNEAFGEPYTAKHETGDVAVLCVPDTAMECDVEDDATITDLITNDDGNEADDVCFQDNAVDRDRDEIGRGDAMVMANDDSASRVEQSLNDDRCDESQIDTLSLVTATMGSHVGSASQAVFTCELENECVLLHQDKSKSLPTFPPSVAMELYVAQDESEKKVVVGTNKRTSPTRSTEADGGDDFGGFEAAPATAVISRSIPDLLLWGPSTLVEEMAIENVDSVSHCAVLATTSTFATPIDDDGFGDFAQSTETRSNDEFLAFGDFEQSSVNNEDSFTDFQQSCAVAFEDNDHEFGDFVPAVAPTLIAEPAVLTPLLSKIELSAFFNEAFPLKPLPLILPDQAESPSDVEEGIDFCEDQSIDCVHDMFRNMWDEYISSVVATDAQLLSSSGSLTTAERKNSDECVRLNRTTKRALKYLKYVLSEKIQEAYKQNGIFAHGSEIHQMYVGLVTSGDADRMLAAVKELQDALFHNSVNNAMMRIAKQAALSAKAKIAEQAAQQQANLRGGSLFFTTRHLLSRGGSSGGANGPSSSGSDGKSDHAGADTPTGVSVQKLARFALANSHDDSANAHRGARNSEERVSDGSDHTGHSSGSDTEAASSADIRTQSQVSLNSSSSNGGLMKKFQDRFSFTSSRHRSRFVSLRRNGQSGEEARKMELNLDAISGGFDEVKWKCALFLYDVKEVAHVAPSQISILAYPSKQPLRGKTDRSALTKLVKSDTIWIVDIGATKSDNC